MATTPITNPTPFPPSGDSIAPSTPPSAVSPIENATKLPQTCTSPLCPISQDRDQGLYLHSCRVALNLESRRIFASTIPPPDVLTRLERCKNEGTKADSELWVAFHEILVGSLLVDVDVVLAPPVPAEMHDNNSVIDECADPGGVSANGAAGRSRHPFGH